MLGIWYGKSPGVDRAGDAIRHGNYAGTARHGGVLALTGDDPACKSSTLPSRSEVTLAALGLVVLYPGTVQDILDLGLHGVALSPRQRPVDRGQDRHAGGGRLGHRDGRPGAHPPRGADGGGRRAAVDPHPDRPHHDPRAGGRAARPPHGDGPPLHRGERPQPDRRRRAPAVARHRRRWSRLRAGHRGPGHAGPRRVGAVGRRRPHPQAGRAQPLRRARPCAAWPSTPGPCWWWRTRHRTSRPSCATRCTAPRTSLVVLGKRDASGAAAGAADRRAHRRAAGGAAASGAGHHDRGRAAGPGPTHPTPPADAEPGGRAHAVLLLGLPAQHRHAGPRGIAGRGGDRLPRHGQLHERRPAGHHHRDDPDGRRGQPVDRHRPLRRRPPPVPERRRRHLLPLRSARRAGRALRPGSTSRSSCSTTPPSP